MRNKTFELKPEHIKLLRKAWIGWDDCEYGAPAIDPKRPYGNSGVEEDIAEILGWKVNEDGLTEKQSEKASEIHLETQTALQIVLTCKTFKPGKFRQNDFCKWEKVRG
jgi:CRISPR/Cas system CMR-associated protein Cmr5 small subunit